MTDTEQRLLRFSEVQARVGFGRTYIYARISEGTFPQPVKVGRDSRWPESEITAWVAQQIAGVRGVTKTPRRRKIPVAPLVAPRR